MKSNNPYMCSRKQQHRRQGYLLMMFKFESLVLCEAKIKRCCYSWYVRVSICLMKKKIFNPMLHAVQYTISLLVARVDCTASVAGWIQVSGAVGRINHNIVVSKNYSSYKPAMSSPQNLPATYWQRLVWIPKDRQEDWINRNRIIQVNKYFYERRTGDRSIAISSGKTILHWRHTNHRYKICLPI